MVTKLSSKIKIPVLDRTGIGGPKEKFPWKIMNVGDSFECSHTFRAAYAANTRYAPKQFTVRQYKDGYRCWRIK